MAHQAGAYPGFRSMKRLRVFLLPPGWDASPSQGYPPALNSPVPIYTPGWREAPNALHLKKYLHVVYAGSEEHNGWHDPRDHEGSSRIKTLKMLGAVGRLF